MKILIISLFLVSCGTSNKQDLEIYKVTRKLGLNRVNTHQQKIDKHLLPYINEFESHFGKVKFSVVFSELEQDDLGYCYLDFLTATKKIQIDLSFWKDMEDKEYGQAMRWCIVFHELHHCANEIMEHDTRLDEDYHYYSIMYPYFDPYNAVHIYQNKQIYIERMKQDIGEYNE